MFRNYEYVFWIHLEKIDSIDFLWKVSFVSGFVPVHVKVYFVTTSLVSIRKCPTFCDTLIKYTGLDCIFILMYCDA